jgi:hypothetical protein
MMQKITITFDTLPYAADFAETMGSKQVVIERHSHTHDITEKLVKAANILGANKIEITEVD